MHEVQSHNENEKIAEIYKTRNVSDTLEKYLSSRPLHTYGTKIGRIKHASDIYACDLWGATFVGQNFDAIVTFTNQRSYFSHCVTINKPVRGIEE